MVSTPNASPSRRVAAARCSACSKSPAQERPALGHAAREVVVPRLPDGLGRPAQVGRGLGQVVRPPGQVAHDGPEVRGHAQGLAVARIGAHPGQLAGAVQLGGGHVRGEPVPQAGLAGCAPAPTGRRTAPRGRRSPGCPSRGPRSSGRRRPAPGRGCPARARSRRSSWSSPQSARAAVSRSAARLSASPGRALASSTPIAACSRTSGSAMRGQPLVDHPGPGEVAGAQVVLARRRTTAPPGRRPRSPAASRPGRTTWPPPRRPGCARPAEPPATA